MVFWVVAKPSVAALPSPAVVVRDANASRRFDSVNAAPKRLRLGRATRLAQTRDFARLRLQGQRSTLGCLVANWKSASASVGSRLGVVTSKKIGGAVQRSRARRLLRESFRRHQHEFKAPVDLVLVARNSIAGKTLSAVEKDFLAVLRRAQLLKD